LRGVSWHIRRLERGIVFLHVLRESPLRRDESHPS